MAKKGALTVAAVVCFACLYGLVTTFVLGGEDEVAPAKEAPESRPWNGEGTHQLNTTFNRRGQMLTFAQARFKGLKGPKAHVIVDLDVPRPASGKKPRWLKASSFFGYQPATAKRYSPTLTVKPTGSSFRATLRFQAVPTSALGPTCAQPGSAASSNPLALNVTGMPGPDFAMQINAPPAPPSHCLNDPDAAGQAPDVVFQRTRFLGKGMVKVSGRVKGKARRVRLVSSGPGKKVSVNPQVNGGRFTARVRLRPGSHVLAIRHGGRLWRTKVKVPRR